MIISNVVGLAGEAIGIAAAIPTSGASLGVVTTVSVLLGVASLTEFVTSIGLAASGSESEAEIVGYVTAGLGVASAVIGGGTGRNLKKHLHQTTDIYTN